VIKLLGSRGASAVMGIFMLALGSSEAGAQNLQALSVPAVVHTLDVNAAVKPLGTAPTVASVTTTAVAPSVAAPAITTSTQLNALRAVPALSTLIPAGWAPTTMADLSNMLSSLVAVAGNTAQPLDVQTDCLAKAVYFESRGEPLEGQLAVANVVINRANSGRYPPDWCGVIKQHAQFSFVRNGELPAPDYYSASWSRAVGIAKIAASKVLTALPQNVLWYHANYVAPTWRHNLTEVEQIGAHIFYRS
jgi:hypothetical protein